MSILITGKTRLLVFGPADQNTSLRVRQMIDYGTDVAGTVDPAGRAERFCGRPLYHSAAEAVSDCAAHAAVVYTSPLSAKTAVLEALNSGIKTVVLTSYGIPVRDSLEIRATAGGQGAMVIGGGTPGCISPGEAMAGIWLSWPKISGDNGTVGLVGCSGSLLLEAADAAAGAGFGISTALALGEDQVPASRLSELLPCFQADNDTQALVIIGTAGGTMELEAARVVQDGRWRKPFAVFTAGDRRKAEVLEAVGAGVAERLSDIGYLLKNMLERGSLS